MRRLIFAIAILPWILIACSTNKSEDAVVNDVTLNEPSSGKLEEVATIAMEDTTGADISAPQEMQNPVAVDWDKKIIKTANVTLEVKKHDNYSSFIRNAVKKYGAYISKENSDATDYKRQTVMSIKVPVLQFESLVNELKTEDANQLERNITSEDVTGGIIDTKARLETRKATRSKYLEFLKQSNKVEDVLKVQQEINDIQEDIESAESRLAQLSGEARYSTINLTYFEPLAGYNADNDKPGFGTRLITAFADGGKFFADIFIGLLTIWPLWLVLSVFLYIVKRYRRNRAVIKRNL
ncbi:DUF4349 domain-containing protein [Niabella ginsengisoli]|uniref:DUF4349 domain-containing protein n=1 Tax=Niabella ginsengisoli TaxID=522298 RepID=A0ABS9SGW4_9BACT|nr:DUF4349 domain-containing protein [Niabella ginsengisoli]MCH5597587.1 DUF4349 domain-containing protein [Niabella ginsengisoli]